MASTNFGVNHKSNHPFVGWIGRMFKKVGYHTIKSFYTCLKVEEFYFGVNLQRATAGVAWAKP